MQEDKEHLFDTADTLALSLAAARGMLETVDFRRERLAAAAADELIAAVDVADLLVRAGVPFREAHGIVAGLVRVALEQGHALSGFSDERARGSWRRRSTRDAFRRCSPATPGSSRRSPPAAPRWCACASSCSPPAPRSPRSELASTRAGCAPSRGS